MVSALRATFFFCLVFCFSPLLQADDNAFDLERGGTLVKHEDSDFYDVTVELGSLVVGKPGTIKLTLNNPYDTAIEFDKALLHCNCLEFHSTAKSIPAKGSLSVTVRLKPPLRQKTRQASSKISLTRADGSPGSIVKIKMKYEAAGLLVMVPQQRTFEIPKHEATGEFRFKFITSKPIEFKNLDVTASDKLRDVKFELEEHDQGGFVIADVPARLVENGPIRGEVAVEDRETGRRASFYCIFRIKEPFKISPRIWYFRSDPANPEHFVTHAIIRISLPKKAESDSESDPKLDIDNSMQEVTVKGALQEESVTISKKAIGIRALRLKVSIAKDRFQMIRKDNAEIPLKLTVWDGKETHELSVKTMFIE